MPGGRAHGIHRDYQVLGKTILVRMMEPIPLEPYSGDGIDVRIMLGSAHRTFDIALRDPTGRIIVAECKRTKGVIKLSHLDAFAHRVALLRQASGTDVAGVYFTRTGYQLGVVKAAADSGIQVALCAPEQLSHAYSLMFQRYSEDYGRRVQDARVMINSGLVMHAELGIARAHGGDSP